ncbi:MAG: DUF1016 N-terminal domain-containing protein [Polyangiales bacterium]
MTAPRKRLAGGPASKRPRNGSATAPKKPARTAGAGALEVANPTSLVGAPDVLFERVVSILDDARTRVVRAVNAGTVVAYWQIGREIVEALQGGEARAEYGARLVEELSARLTARYGKGFSTSNLWSFRQFYLAYATRRPASRILHPSGRESTDATILHPPGGESVHSFDPTLSWSHYRALMRVTKPAARDFYEQEAVSCGWSKVQLERQI